MKIFLFLDISFSDEEGGLSRDWLNEFAGALRERGHEPIFFSPREHRIGAGDILHVFASAHSETWGSLHRVGARIIVTPSVGVVSPENVLSPPSVFNRLAPSYRAPDYFLVTDEDWVTTLSRYWAAPLAKIRIGGAKPGMMADVSSDLYRDLSI